MVHLNVVYQTTLLAEKQLRIVFFSCLGLLAKNVFLSFVLFATSIFLVVRISGRYATVRTRGIRNPSR